MLEAKTVCAIFKDNLQLCSEVSESVIQHFVQCIETQGRHVQYLQFLQTIVKAEGRFIRKSQDMVMKEVCVCCYFVCYTSFFFIFTLFVILKA